MKKTILLGMVALLVVGLMTAGAVSAYRGDYTKKGPDYSEDRHELMEQAFDSNDYDAWKALMTETGRNPRVVDVVTPENFETFVKAHEAGERGDYDEAAKLRAELGLGNGHGMHDGSGNGMRDGSGKEMRGQRMGQGSGDRMQR